MGLLKWLLHRRAKKASPVLVIRPLFASDFNNGFVEALAALSPVSISQQDFGWILTDRLRKNIETIICLADN
jgi:hypothetical protein